MPGLHALPGTDHVVAGVRLHVVSHGDGGGVPVLCLHGAGGSARLWSNVQRALGHRHATHAPDLLGCGASETPVDGRLDIAVQARAMLNLLDALALERVAVLAHDVGGGVAAQLMAIAPERVPALILTGTPMHADAWPSGSVADTLGFRSRVPSRRLRRAVDPSAVESAYRIVRTRPPTTLVVWGAEDTSLSAAYGRRLAADLGATFVQIMDAGHALPVERPERLAEESEAWLADVQPRLSGH